MTARLPRARMHENRRVEPLNVVAHADHGVPPAVLQIALQLDPERTVIPDGSRAAVNFGRLKDEAASLAQRHELVHHILCCHLCPLKSCGWRLAADDLIATRSDAH